MEQPLSLEAKELIEEIKTIQKDVFHRKLKITRGNNITYDFSDYKKFKDLFRDLYHEFGRSPSALEIYSAKKKEYIEAKNKLLDNSKKIYKGRKKIIERFKNGIFPLNYDKEKEQEFRDKEEDNKIRNKNGLLV